MSQTQSKTCPVCQGRGRIFLRYAACWKHEDCDCKEVFGDCDECGGEGTIPVYCLCGGPVPADLEDQCEACFAACEAKAASVMPELILPTLEVLC